MQLTELSDITKTTIMLN